MRIVFNYLILLAIVLSNINCNGEIKNNKKNEAEEDQDKIDKLCIAITDPIVCDNDATCEFYEGKCRSKTIAIAEKNNDFNEITHFSIGKKDDKLHFDNYQKTIKELTAIKAKFGEEKWKEYLRQKLSTPGFLNDLVKNSTTRAFSNNDDAERKKYENAGYKIPTVMTPQAQLMMEMATDLGKEFNDYLTPEGNNGETQIWQVVMQLPVGLQKEFLKPFLAIQAPAVMLTADEKTSGFGNTSFNTKIENALKGAQQESRSSLYAFTLSTSYQGAINVAYFLTKGVENGVFLETNLDTILYIINTFGDYYNVNWETFLVRMDNFLAFSVDKNYKTGKLEETMLTAVRNNEATGKEKILKIASFYKEKLGEKAAKKIFPKTLGL